MNCLRQRDWAQWCLCLEQLVDVRNQKQSLKRKLDHHQEKLRFQQRLQEQHGDSKMVIVHEYNPDVNPVRIRFEIISKHVDLHIQITPLVPSHDIKESSNEEVVETSYVGLLVRVKLLRQPMLRMLVL